MNEEDRDSMRILIHNKLLKFFTKIAIANSEKEGLKLTAKETKDFFEVMYPIMKKIQDVTINDLLEKLE